jgi:hypothetical protein
MILLQVNPTFGDELETVCEGYYETKNIFIFAWSSILTLDTIVGCMVRFVNYFLGIRWTT